MIDPRVQKLAQVLVRYSTDVQSGETVRIAGTTASEPLLREVYREVLRAGAHPVVRLRLTDEDHLFYSSATDAELDYADPLLIRDVENIDVSIRTLPDENPHALTTVDPAKKQRRLRSMTPMTEAFLRRWREGKLRWVGSAYPTEALAQEAHMSLDEFADFVFESGKLNEENPVDYWKAVSARQEKICKRLNQCSTIRYVGLDTDLTFSCRGRTWVNCAGKENFPDGEVFTGPVEDSVNGTIRFTFPAIYQGQEVEDIFLRFKNGKVEEARAAKGESLLHKLLQTDPGASYVGEIAIGTNDNIRRFTKNMLFDEKMGGTVHLAVGFGIPASGSKNFSALHWDMLKDMRDGGEIHADGVLIYRNGRFLQEGHG
jgi:aminopeptidase